MRATLDTILGRAFAIADAGSQAELLNAAGAYARRTYQDADVGLEMQACTISDELTEDGWAFIRALSLFDPKRKD